MSLPFGALSWENFERLCYRLALKTAAFDRVLRYGRPGQNQSGIDIFARSAAGRYEVWQAKRYKSYGVGHLKKAIKTFLTGDWVSRTETFIIAVQASLDDTRLQDEVERQTDILAKKGIRLEMLGGDALVERVRPFQDLVLAFFGRAWLTAFYGDAVDSSVCNQLDGPEYAHIREQLTRLYTARFSDLDQGAVATRFSDHKNPPKPMALLDRYTVPDVYVREKEIQNKRTDRRQASGHTEARDLARASQPVEGVASDPDQVRRRPVSDWLSDGDQIAIVADAGAGKSTLLRAVALDLLSEQSVFPALASRWGDRLPIVVSFAQWARATVDRRGDVGLKDLVELTLQPFLTVNLVSFVHRAIDEQRIVLIVDGLDEWSAEQAARTTLQTLLTFVQVHQVPTIVSGRPHGLSKIGGLPQTWKMAELAPLSPSQQRRLALVWFGRLRATGTDEEAENATATWEAERFLKELRADAGLGDLAGTPLLFIGLLFLAMRNVALPRNRAQALQSLVTLLLEVHPEARATAAGEVTPRFDQASAPELRQAAVAALAFASRRYGGDAGYPRSEARLAIRDHLTSDAVPDARRALAIADEILAVNSETVGLIVEKAPNDVGFAHASLEEFLSALHIQSWRFTELLAFVEEKAGDPRWRNVLRNLVAINTRPSEIDAIVAAVKSAETDAAGDFSRRQLLAEIAFSPSRMSAGTALRLADATFDIIEGPGVESERAAMIRAALQGLSDSVLQGEVERRLGRWAPRRDAYPGQIFSALATWPADDTLLSALCVGLGDEELSAARAASRGLAARFGGQAQAEVHLRRLCGTSAELKTAAAALEALVRGWPDASLAPLIKEARASRDPLLRATAILARTLRSEQDDEDLDKILELTSDAFSWDFRYRDIAQEALLTGWPDNDRVVDAALDALKEQAGRGTMDRELAFRVLTHTKPGRPRVKAWILEELSRDFPFSMTLGENWEPLLHFAKADIEIRTAFVALVLGSAGSFREHYIWPIIAGLDDERLRDYAIDQTRATDRHTRYWNLLPLVRGWAGDQEVQALFQEMIALEDEQIGMVAVLLPEMYADPEDARARLIRIALAVPNARRDLIARALQDLGCTGEDDDAVQAFLPHLHATDQRPFEPVAAYLIFASHPEIRKAALRRLEEPDPPIAILARAYPDEPTIAERALATACALPANLRAVVVASCGVGGDRHPALGSVLAQYNEEMDFHLRVQLSIDHHSFHRGRGSEDDLVEQLAEELDRPDHRFEERRAANFAGLVVLDAAERIMTAKRKTGTVSIESYMSRGLSGALGDLIVDRWSTLKSQLGDNFVDRVIKGSDQSLWPSLSRFIGPNPEARREFLDWCANQEQIGFTALRSLAALWPGSDVLLTHAVRAATMDHGFQETLSTVVVAAEILKNQFPTSDHRDALRARFAEVRDLNSAVALAIFDPAAPDLCKRKVSTLELARDYGQWLGAVQIAVHLETPGVVVDLVHAMAEREAYPGRQDQLTMTAALVDRLSRDATALAALRASLDGPLSATAFAASASLLAAAGRLDSSGFILCAQKLKMEQDRRGLPKAVLDVRQDRWRALSHVLGDLVQAPSL